MRPLLDPAAGRHTRNTSPIVEGFVAGMIPIGGCHRPRCGRFHDDEAVAQSLELSSMWATQAGGFAPCTLGAIGPTQDPYRCPPDPVGGYRDRGEAVRLVPQQQSGWLIRPSQRDQGLLAGRSLPFGAVDGKSPRSRSGRVRDCARRRFGTGRRAPEDGEVLPHR